MFSKELLQPEELQAFFEKHKIPLQNAKKVFSRKEVIGIYFDAEKINQGLSGFILGALIDSDKIKMETNFEDYEDLYKMYVSFVIGLSGTRDSA